VALRPSATATADELVAYCKERLLPYKAPVRIAFLDALPKGGSGKILRRELRALLAAGDP
jgi:long-chain acyl-CoA synthetase